MSLHPLKWGFPALNLVILGELPHPCQDATVGLEILILGIKCTNLAMLVEQINTRIIVNKFVGNS